MSEINEQDRLHQLLCAYVLGEADAAERAIVEVALARDPALREERDRIAATIGLVKSTLERDETLSYQATSEVTRAAADMQPRPVPANRPWLWHESTSLRVAASFVAIVGASFLGWRAFVTSRAERGSMMTAKVELPAPAERVSEAGRELSSAERDSLRTLGYVSTGSPAPAGEAKGSQREPGDTVPPAKRTELAEPHFSKANERSLALRAAGLKDQAKPLDGTTAPVDKVEELYLPRAEVAEADRSSNRLRLLDEESGFDSLFVGSEPPLSQPTGKLSSDEFHLGKLEVATAASGTPAPAEQPPALAAGEKLSWVVGSGGGGPATPGAQIPGRSAGTPAPSSKPKAGGDAGGTGPSGPASPGPAGPVLPERAAAAGVAGEPAFKSKFDALVKEGAPVDELRGQFLENVVKGEIKPRELTQLVDDLDDKNESQEQTEFERLDRFKEARKADAGLDETRQQPPRRILTPEERAKCIEQVIVSCRRLPNERPRDMFFRFWGDNPFEWTANDRQSTFSMDVDTASYTLARKYLVDGHLPEKAQIRTEEFVNYFKPDVAPPTKGTFTIATEFAPSRFSNPMENKWMLRVAVRGQEIAKNERPPLALTLVVDISGSMKEQNRLELVKHAMRQLVGQLDPRDSIAIVAFSADSRLMLPMTSAGKRDLIESAINPLQPDGGTNTEAGLRMGYEQALSALTANSINRVVLLTDGVANIGIVDPNVITQSVERQRKAGIYLNTIGVGMNNHNDHLLEQLADKGDGVCNYVDDAAEVKHVLVDNLLQTLVPIARDAKVQVDFDPAQVQSYRLLGYENRAIADQDFRNDKIDAGEINSGHQITALYEIVRVGNLQDQAAPLAKVNVRFKPPHRNGVAQPASEEASEISSPIYAKNAAIGFEATSYGYRRAVLAAQFAEFLRRSVHARGDSLDQLIADLQKLTGEKNEQETAELSDMVVRSKNLLQAEFARRGDLEHAVYLYRMGCYERARAEAQLHETDSELLHRMDEQVASLEGTLRTLLENRLK